ncbi:hypothetical protein [Thiomonas sp. X19]|uniref:hypothetical protein n=1 Tax=Thiomonas sp. X19 TaxID=1050370 RepID=UPI001E5B1487|nr:hypothetical protein [Thiomonas sp. X19]
MAMKRWSKPWRLWAGAAALGLCGWAQAGVLPGPLATPLWLNAHVKEVQVVDIRDNLSRKRQAAPSFLDPHGGRVGEPTLGALNTLSDDPKFTTVNGKKGLDVVGGHIIDALSVNFWGLQQNRDIDGKQVDFLLPTAGQIAVLDGGTHAWIAAGYPVDTDAIAAMTSSQWKAEPPSPKLLASTAQVQAAQRARKPLLDARPPAPDSCSTASWACVNTQAA